MFLKCRIRKKDGKEHRSWSIEESRRVGKKVLQRHVLYLGELSESQQRATCGCWRAGSSRCGGANNRQPENQAGARGKKRKRQKPRVNRAQKYSKTEYMW